MVHTFMDEIILTSKGFASDGHELFEADSIPCPSMENAKVESERAPFTSYLGLVSKIALCISIGFGA